MFDYFGNPCDELKSKKLFLLDMDGTIYNEKELFDGSLDFLKYIETIGGRYVFITNNSSRSVYDYVKKVQKLGIKANIGNFYSSAQATVKYLNEHYRGAKVFCMGTQSFLNELENEDINVTTEVCDDAKIVLIGYDTELNYQKLKNTVEMLGKDVVYIATNPDLVCPVSFGFVPDCGSMAKMLETSTGRKPLYIGKPEATMANFVMEKFNCTKEETAVVGDRLYTDIAIGLNAGTTAICVLTGEATVDEITNSNIKPDYTFENIRALYNAVTKNI